ncbi:MULTISPECIES: hypothetical protein [Caulobacter]|jgi:hypothetical protein|uniref:Uncharacterized protein n=1 Tax=Caulobacter vibrioides OR37 TaxID=1292034 RepID=R0E9L2_CAUVI|nr:MULTISPECIES: hypothetical protein [Caulobacter]ENZ82153.1 hypothetical protein OR37_01965 [Caulobacter vibrioides OR37]MBQ1559850.1 hypothetical protein [Caulobacter sp.]
MRLISIAATLLVLTSPAMAQTASPQARTATPQAPIRAGQILRDVNKVRLGPINTVKADGSVVIIFDSHFKTIPADKVNVINGQPTTSLTRGEVFKLD